jgi:hypothetical protein
MTWYLTHAVATRRAIAVVIKWKAERLPMLQDTRLSHYLFEVEACRELCTERGGIELASLRTLYHSS